MRQYGQQQQHHHHQRLCSCAGIDYQQRRRDSSGCVTYQSTVGSPRDPFGTIAPLGVPCPNNTHHHRKLAPSLEDCKAASYKHAFQSYQSLLFSTVVHSFGIRSGCGGDAQKMLQFDPQEWASSIDTGFLPSNPKRPPHRSALEFEFVCAVCRRETSLHDTP